VSNRIRRGETVGPERSSGGQRRIKGLEMRLRAVFAGVLGFFALVGVAGEASAQVVARAPALTMAEAASAQRSVPAAPRRGLRWNENGRWGLDFNLNQPVGRETGWGDVEAGAYYRLSPRLRVGAAAGLATPAPDPARAPETDRRAQPRVRLETLFRF
jgi:hypothetical protein